jgi:DNA recombination-dependent growth factor C
MTLSFPHLQSFKVDKSGISDVITAALASSVIPDDIGVMTKYSGFTTLSETIGSTVIHVDEVILLAYGSAKKVVTRRQEAKLLQPLLAAGAENTAGIRRQVREELLSRMPQSLTWYPILIDPISNMAFISGGSSDQILEARRALLKCVPSLKLEFYSGVRWPTYHLSSWLKSESKLPEHVEFGRLVRLMKEENTSICMMSEVTLPNDEILRQLDSPNSFVAELGLIWDENLRFIVKGSLTIGGLTAINDFRKHLNALKEIDVEIIRIEQEVHAWLDLLRPLMTCLMDELTRPPADIVEDEPRPHNHNLPFIFDPEFKADNIGEKSV